MKIFRVNYKEHYYGYTRLGYFKTFEVLLDNFEQTFERIRTQLNVDRDIFYTKDYLLGVEFNSLDFLPISIEEVEVND